MPVIEGNPKSGLISIDEHWIMGKPSTLTMIVMVARAYEKVRSTGQDPMKCKMTVIGITADFLEEAGLHKHAKKIKEQKVQLASKMSTNDLDEGDVRSFAAALLDIYLVKDKRYQNEVKDQLRGKLCGWVASNEEETEAASKEEESKAVSKPGQEEEEENKEEETEEPRGEAAPKVQQEESKEFSGEATPEMSPWVAAPSSSGLEPSSDVSVKSPELELIKNWIVKAYERVRSNGQDPQPCKLTVIAVIADLLEQAGMHTHANSIKSQKALLVSKMNASDLHDDSSCDVRKYAASLLDKYVVNDHKEKDGEKNEPEPQPSARWVPPKEEAVPPPAARWGAPKKQESLAPALALNEPMYVTREPSIPGPFQLPVLLPPGAFINPPPGLEDSKDQEWTPTSRFATPGSPFRGPGRRAGGRGRCA